VDSGTSLSYKWNDFSTVELRSVNSGHTNKVKLREMYRVTALPDGVARGHLADDPLSGALHEAELCRSGH